jgi:conjugal transfer pilin signal peptidase TrbI
VGDFLRHARQRWYLYLPIVAIWSLAYVRLFIDATPRVPILFNWTPSLPYRVAWLQHGPSPTAARRLHRFLLRRRGAASLSGITRSTFLQDRARFAGRHRNRQPAGR